MCIYCHVGSFYVLTACESGSCTLVLKVSWTVGKEGDLFLDVFSRQVLDFFSLIFCFSASLLLCFSCFSAFPASLLFCFSAFCFPCFSAFLLLFSLLLCFCTSVPFYFYYSTFSFLQSCVLAAPLPAPLLLCFLSLLYLCFSFSVALFCSVCIRNETLERP